MDGARQRVRARTPEHSSRPIVCVKSLPWKKEKSHTEGNMNMLSLYLRLQFSLHHGSPMHSARQEACVARALFLCRHAGWNLSSWQPPRRSRGITCRVTGFYEVWSFTNAAEFWWREKILGSIVGVQIYREYTQRLVLRFFRRGEWMEER